jgi:hypothetical protein
MPRLPIDYKQTIIYKLCCKNISITEIYVGHTTNFTKRKNCHSSSCNNEKQKEYNYPVYQFIRENGGWDNWTMILIEEYSCDNKLQASQRERYWLETLNATLNNRIPSRTQQEYYEENREIIIEKNKKYRETNEERILQQRATYREENREKINEIKKIKIICECGVEINKNHLARHRTSIKHQNYLQNK